MHIFCIRYEIVLLLIISQKFCSAYVKNVTNERIAQAKVITDFFKVPWINFNSSQTGNVVSPQCKKDVATVFESADDGEMWALQMLDAASKIPAGILNGNIRDLGMYDQCIGLNGYQSPEKMQGRHCMVSLSIPSKFVAVAADMLHVQKLSVYNPSAGVDLSLTISVCLPSSCSVNDVFGFVNASIQSKPELFEFETKVARVICSPIEVSEDLNLGIILTTLFLAIIITLLLICTVCDCMVKAGYCKTTLTVKTLAKYSMYTNAKKLLNTKVAVEAMPAIHGVRFLSTCLIVAGHRTMTTLARPLVNLTNIHDWRQSITALITFSIPCVVDTFFVMSGFLTAYSFLKALGSGKKFNTLTLYLHRYLRLTPCVAVMVLLNIFVLPRIGSGPMWESSIGVSRDYCRKNWWTNLLYMQNVVNREEMCLPHTWYLAVEMHLFWICPIILYPLYHRPKFGLTMLSVLTVTSFIIPGVQLAVNKWPAFCNIINKNFAVISYEFFNSYTVTFNRALPYLIGILLGYDVVNNKRQITKVQVIFNWILACSLILFCVWATYFKQPVSLVYDVVWEVLHVTVIRLVWSIAVAWILYACTQGYGGPVTRFLSLPVFVPLSRLCYCIYLVHFPIQVGSSATVRTAGFFTPLNEFYLIWGDLALSIAAAFVLNLCFETPITVLEKIVNEKGSSAAVKHTNVAPKDRKVATITRAHSDLTRGRKTFDCTVESVMSHSDFRRISDIAKLLNNLQKRPTKIPAEWATTRQERKSDVLENDSQPETPAKDNHNGSHQFQTSTTGITEMKKEFLTFLATASCVSNDITSLKGFKIAESVRSELDSRDCQDKENLVLSSTSSSTPFAKKTN